MTSKALSSYITLLFFVMLVILYIAQHDLRVVPTEKDLVYGTSTPSIKIVENGTTLSGKLQLINMETAEKQPFSTKLDQIKNNTFSVSVYHYEPYLTLSGSNHTDIASNSSLQLTKFSVAAWFRTNMDVPFRSNAFIVNKGGVGANMPGQNMNYGIWIGDSETIRAGFETSSSEPMFFVKSLKTYNLYHWHYVVMTYDGSFLRLYIDGEQVANKYTNGAIPDNTGKQPVRIGANSYALNGYYIGNIDEVRIWNRALNDSEIADEYDKGAFNTTGQVLYLPFG